VRITRVPIRSELLWQALRCNENAEQA